MSKRISAGVVLALVLVAFAVHATAASPPVSPSPAAQAACRQWEVMITQMPGVVGPEVGKATKMQDGWEPFDAHGVLLYLRRCGSR